MTYQAKDYSGLLGMPGFSETLLKTISLCTRAMSTTPISCWRR